MTIYYNSDFESDTINTTPTGWETGLGAGMSVQTATAVGLVAVSGTRIIGRTSVGDTVIYTAAGLIGNQGMRTDQKIPDMTAGGFRSAGHAPRNQGSATGFSYRVFLGTTGGTAGSEMLTLQINVNDGSTIVLVPAFSLGFHPGPTDVVHLESVFIGTTLDVRVWMNSSARPSSPTATTTNSLFPTGYPAIRNYGNNGWTSSDNVVIADGATGLDFYDPAVDATIPVMSGSLTSASITTTGFTLNWSAASDNVAVTGYQFSLNNGSSWTDAGLVLTRVVTGLTSSTAYNCQVRAYDAAGNFATPISATVTTATVDSTNPVLTGTLVSSSITSSGYTLTWPAASDNVAVTGYEVSTDSSSTWVDKGNVLTTNITGAAAATLYHTAVRAYDASGNRSSALLLDVTTGGSADTTAPVLTGSITPSAITQTGFTITWPAGSDNVSLTGYEYSINAGSTYTAVGNVLTTNVTGLTNTTLYPVRVRAIDSSGNRSTPALSADVTTASPALGTITTIACANRAKTLWASLTGVTVVVFNLALAPIVTKTSQSINSSGILTVTDAAIVAGTSYWIAVFLANGTSAGIKKYIAS
jgi:chitodextrinase